MGKGGNAAYQHFLLFPKCFQKPSSTVENCVNPFPNDKFRLFQTKRVCRQQFQNLMKMADSSPKGLKNTVGKGEIACYEQFLLFSKCFQKTPTANT